MDVFATIAVGFICGILIGLPYVVSLVYMKRTHEASVVPGLIAVAASFLLMAVCVLVGWKVLGQDVLWFAVGMLVGFFAAIGIAAVWFLHKPRH